MYGVHLFRLARLAGVRKIDIARHLGVVKVQPTLWSQGKRPIPDDRLPPLVGLIAQAVKKRLVDAAPWDTIRAELTTTLRACFIENCQRHVAMKEPSLEAFLADVEQYAALTHPQRQHAPRLEDMERLSAAMLCWFKLENVLLPLRRLLPDEEQPQLPASAEEIAVR